MSVKRNIQMVNEIKSTVQTENSLSNNNFNSLKTDIFNMSQSNKNELLKVVESAAKLEESKQSLTKLADQMAGFQNILNDKKVRGVFGETQLYSIYESVFGQPGKLYEKQYKLTSGLIADSVVYGSQSLGLICVDSKFPLENFNKMNNTELTEEARASAAKQFKQDVQFKINDIASKYIVPGETADFAFMFIAAESVYNDIVANYQGLIELSHNKKVFITSPTNLIAYLSSIKALWLEIDRSKNLVKFQNEVKKLSDEFVRFENRRVSLEKDTEKLVGDMKQLAITGEKISRRFESLTELELEQENKKET